jgi:hypothetical protein
MRSGVQDRGAAQLSAVATLDLTAGGGEGDGGTAGIGGDAAGQMDAPEEDADRQLHSFEIEGAQVLSHLEWHIALTQQSGSGTASLVTLSIMINLACVSSACCSSEFDIYMSTCTWVALRWCCI